VASWRGVIELPAPEVRRLTTVLPLVLERARSLRVADGTVLDPWNGDGPLDLHVVDGTHPLVGTRYVGTYHAVSDDDVDPADDDVGPDRTDTDSPSDRDEAPEQWPSTVDHEWTATIEADDTRSARVTVIDGTGTDDEIHLTIDVPDPAQPTEMRLTGLVPVSPDGFMAGDIEAEGAIVWGPDSPGDGGRRRIATVTIGHPRFRAGIVADAETMGDTWRVTAEGFVSGRGLVRPLFALMMVFVARKMRPVLDRRFSELAEHVEQWNTIARDHERDGDLADALVDQWLDHFRRS
jgi:hypothetical protein